MNMMDFKDMLDARRDIDQAERHGDSDSIMAYRDRREAEKARETIRRIEAQDSARAAKYGYG